jgi:hypothetical protein
VIDVSIDVLVAGAIPGDEDPFRHISFPWPMAATRDASPKRSGHIRTASAILSRPSRAVVTLPGVIPVHPCGLAVTAAHAATPVAESANRCCA